MLKEQILEALKTKYKAYGLSNDALDRIASLREKTVEKAEDIEGAVADATTLDLIAKEIQRQRDQAIQKNSESQRAFEAYKAAHPEPDKGGEGDKDNATSQDIASIVKAAVADAVAPLNEKITALETSKSAEAALSTAHSSFFNGDYTSPVKLFEFMACGIPPVAPDFVPIREVLKEDETGWMFKAGDLESAVQMVLRRSQDSDNLRRVGQAARAYIARERQWRNNILQLVDFRERVKGR